MALDPLAVGDLIAAMWTSPRNVRLVKSARFKCRVGWCLRVSIVSLTQEGEICYFLSSM